jgi:hypothetical protein
VHGPSGRLGGPPHHPHQTFLWCFIAARVAFSTGGDSRFGVNATRLIRRKSSQMWRQRLQSSDNPAFILKIDLHNRQFRRNI